jgi:PAS domain S-box-containing protein
MAPKTFIVHVMPPDHLHQLEELAQTALAALPCKLVWLLSVDDGGLVHQAVAAEDGAEAEQHFLSLVQPPTARFSLVNHPLADVAINGEALINVPVVEWREMAGGAALHRAFTEFRLPLISALPLVASGEVVGVLVVATMDALVPERTHSLSSRAAMVVENARLRAFREVVLDAMGEGLLMVNQEARITFVNNRLLLMTGYEREALYGRSVGMIFHPDQREQLVRSLSSQAHGTLSFSQKLMTREGRALPVMLSRATVPGSSGQSTVLFVSDLSELQRHEEALERQTLRLQGINRASNAISSASSLQDVLHASLDAALEIVSGVAASILLLDPDNPNLLTAVAASGPHVSQLRRTADLDDGRLWAASTSRSCWSRMCPSTNTFRPNTRCFTAWPHSTSSFRWSRSMSWRRAGGGEQVDGG